MGADNYHWRMVGRGEDDRVAELEADGARLRGLILRIGTHLEYIDDCNADNDSIDQAVRDAQALVSQALVGKLGASPQSGTDGDG